MNWLARYYDNRTLTGDPLDFLAQVGHTEGGLSISDIQFQSMLSSLRTTLDLKDDDVLLDLCCGNGVFTRHLAADVQSAVGIDFSRELIGIAEKHNPAGNLDYHVRDVRKLVGGLPEEGIVFNKILMNAGLQHFTPVELRGLLQSMLASAAAERVLVFSFVPDFDKRDAFFEALKPGFKLRLRRLLGRDLLAHWWKRGEVAEIAASVGLKAEFLDVDPALDGARYRFDIRMS